MTAWLGARWNKCADVRLGCGGIVRIHAAALLDGRALHGTVGTEDAAIASLRPKQSVTPRAFVEVEACVGWHRFDRCERAVRTGEHRLEDWLRMHWWAPNESR